MGVKRQIDIELEAGSRLRLPAAGELAH